jgi:hypothetical protein
MTEKPQTDLVVQTDVLIDKNDIVAVAVAQAEMKIRNNVKRCKQKIEDNNTQIDVLVKKFKTDGENMMNKKFAAKFKSIDLKIQSLKLDLKIEKEFNIQRSGNALNEHGKNITNQISIYIIHVDSKQTINLIDEKFPATKAQVALAQSIKNLKDLNEDLTTEGANWRKKLSDIPAIERQMRAKVAEAEMNKTETGRKILSSMLENLDSTIKMIG